MKEKFLNSLSNCGNELDVFISRFMDIKENIGNGVGAGKLFERLFVDFINRHNDNSMKDVYALHLNLSNSHFIWDIIISDNPNLTFAKEEIIFSIRNNVDIEQQISKIIGENWIGVSLKTYKEDACQITTDYSYRTYLEEKVGESVEINESIINDFYNLLNKHNKNRYVILALNTYDKIGKIQNDIQSLKIGLTKLKNESRKDLQLDKIYKLESLLEISKNSYTFRLLSFDKKFDKISYKQNVKLSQYDLSIDGINYFKVLYGKNQANPFQRGIWTHNNNSIDYFKLIKSGSYQVDGYFQKMISSTIFD
jgi:hypothetical protein